MAEPHKYEPGTPSWAEGQQMEERVAGSPPQGFVCGCERKEYQPATWPACLQQRSIMGTGGLVCASPAH